MQVRKEYLGTSLYITFSRSANQGNFPLARQIPHVKSYVANLGQNPLRQNPLGQNSRWIKSLGQNPLRQNPPRTKSPRTKSPMTKSPDSQQLKLE